MGSELKKEALSRQIYSRLREMIANYRFKAGSHLNVEKLAKEFGVSRTPVWEAIRRLEQEGLLYTIPNRGVFMVEMTPAMAEQLYQVREVLEGLVGKLAARNAKEKAVLQLGKCLEEQAQAVKANDLVRYSQLDFKFHAKLYEMCANPILQEMLENIKTKMRPFAVHLKPILPKLYENHKKIFDSIRRGDPVRAQETFLAHNQVMQEQIRREIARPDPDAPGSRKTGIHGAA